MRLFRKRNRNETQSEQTEKRKLSPMKKLAVSVMAVITTVAAVLIPTGSPVFAASIYKHYVGMYYNGTVAGMVTYNGEAAYCIQMETHMPKPWGHDGQSGDVYATTALDAYNAMDSATKQRIAAITYYGYGYGGRTSYLYYYAAQQAIWDLQGYPNISWSGYASTSQVQAAKNEILADVNAYINNSGRQASFTIRDASGNVVGTSGANASFDKALIGATYTITDDNGYLSSSSVSANDFGGRAKVNGNKITVTMDESDYEVNRTYRVTTGGSALTPRGQSVVLYAGSYQNLITVSTPSQSNNSASFTLKGYGVPTEFTKKDENGRALAGAKLTLYKVSGSTETPVESYTTTGESKHFDLCPGTYKMVETEAPLGYYLSRPVTFTVAKKPYETQYFEMQDKPIKASVKKLDDKDGKPVIGATLEMQDGQYQTLETWQTTADSHILNGSRMKAGEKYYISEPNPAPGYYDLEDDVVIQIPLYAPADDQLVNGYYEFGVKDKPLEYYVEKRNADTMEFVSGAHLQIKDSDGTVIHDFVTGDEPYRLPNDVLRMGQTYTIHEVEAPPGFYKMAADQPFTVDSHFRGQAFRFVAYDKPIPCGIQKVDEDGNTITGAVLALYAKDDPSTEIDRWTTANGMHSIANLKDGTTYIVKELQAPAGYYKVDTAMEFTVSAPSDAAQDEGQKIYFEDPRVTYQVQKIDAKKKTRLAGVKIQLIEDGNVLTTVTTADDKAVDIPDGILQCGHTYTLHESESIPGYYFSDGDVTFTVPTSLEEAKKLSKEVFTLTIEDKPIQYSVLKVDEKSGETVSGAKLALYDSVEDAAKPLFTWESTDEPFKISDYVKLKAGADYYIREMAAPDGYYQTASMTKIHVPENVDTMATVKVSFVNKHIEWHIKKVDTEGNLLTTGKDGSFVTLEVYDTNETLDNIDDDTLVATLETNDKDYAKLGYFDMKPYIEAGAIKGLCHYRVHEKTPATGYLEAEDIIQQIKVGEDNDTILSSMEDEKVEVYIKKVDEEGNLLTTYTNLDGTKEGFEIAVYDDATGNEVFRFDTSSKSYQDAGHFDASEYLAVGKTYTAKEIKYPRGYFRAKDYSFTVKSASQLEDKTIVMVDPTLRAQFRKEDENGNVVTTVEGDSFKFQIFDTMGTDDISDDKVIGTIDSADGDKATGGWIDIGHFLQEAKTYRIHEVYAPYGYEYQTTDAYITTPGYYDESVGTVQNVIIHPDEFVTFTIGTTPYTAARDLTVEEFTHEHSKFTIATIDGEDVLVDSVHQKQVVYYDSGAPVKAATKCSSLAGKTLSAPK